MGRKERVSREKRAGTEERRGMREERESKYEECEIGTKYKKYPLMAHLSVS